MIETNEYFDGNVKSLTLQTADGKKTVGVIGPGEYEFNTDAKETMSVVSGDMEVFFPEYDEWEEFSSGASFDVPGKSSFKVKVQSDVAYLCEYEG